MGAFGWPDWVVRLMWQENIEVGEDPAEPSFLLKRRKPADQPWPQASDLSEELVHAARVAQAGAPPAEPLPDLPIQSKREPR